MIPFPYCVYAKVYGERNSGTTFVEQLIRANFVVSFLRSESRISEFINAAQSHMTASEGGRFRSAVTDIDCERTLRSEFGWKHGIPPRDEILRAPHSTHTLFVCVAKHPVPWLRSLFKRPYNPIERAPRKFPAFIRYEWPVTHRDNLPGRERIAVTDLWNVKNEAFQDLRTVVAKCMVVTYEDILRNPKAFLTEVGRHLLPRSDELVWSLPSTKGDGMSFEDYRRKYDPDTACAAISRRDLEHVAAHIDARIMARFGYSWPGDGHGPGKQ